MNYIDIDKERELGEVIKDSIKFFYHNFKNLFKAYILYAGPFILIAAYALYTIQIEFLGYFFEMAETKQPSQEFSDSFLRIYFTIIMAYSVICTMVSHVFNEYLLKYNETGGNVTDVSFIWSNMFPKILKLLAVVIFSTSLTFVGLTCFIAPGIFLFISFSSIFIITAVKNSRTLDIITESVKLTLRNWWSTMTLIIILFLIYIIINIVVGSLGNILDKIDFQNPDKELLKLSTFRIVVNLIISLISNFLLGVVYIALSLNYFSVIKKMNR